jgi:2Fe-2S ferredoxin
MPKIIVKNLAGEEQEIDAKSGISVMEALRDNGVDELLAICGGCLSCATCHVYIESNGVEGLPEISEDENDLLDSLEERDERSRLSCQITLTDNMEGLKVEVAPEE